MTSFIDTNILLYLFSTRASEATKREISANIMSRPDLVVSTQVLQEFIVQAIKPGREDRMPLEEARNFLISLRRFETVVLSLELFESALDITARYRFSYWDSAITAAALAAKCDILYTEDLHHGQVIDGLRIVNPFKDEPAGVI